ncbi:polyisoprenoid-binding protein YceI [Larkinella arboricola]|uniref:Polyisoprenoid-binding protein YceI n=1 Tax=Larkinella arboricola TaxID=643671 RepID=A0A327X856_LARAB|nr:YceI family protein [Larkinella arboricola]RAK02063.1 polyisoprenoid-binding protein YceI [Larkinella arboricola]
MKTFLNPRLTGWLLLVSAGLMAFHPPNSTPELAKRKLMADRTKSTITYAMSHPMHSFEGVSRDVACVMVVDDANKIESVAAAAKLSSFDSDNTNRDSHALETMEALKYPKVTFTSNDIQQDGNNLTIKGNLTFHGVTKPVVIQANRQDGNAQITVKGDFDIKLSDYKIERPSLMMVPVEETVKLKIHMVFKDTAS